MKKIILTAAIIISSVSFANAQTESTEPQAEQTEQTVVENVFKPVAITELSSTIQSAITTAAGAEFDIKTVEFNAATEQAKATLENKETKEIKCVCFDKDGKEVN